MLRVKNLDQKDFFEINENIKRRIHTYFPEWTDENYHDPGITFLEMLVWLEDMQRYYLNRVTDKNYRRFFKLLGQKSIKTPLATTHLTFDKEVGHMKLPKGFKTFANDRCFEIDSEVNIFKTEVQSFLATDAKQNYDYSYACGNEISFFPFGEKMTVGNKFFIGISDFSIVDKEVSVFFDLEDDHLIEKKCGYTPGIGHELLWEVLDIHNKWVELKIIEDETYNFSESGVLKFICHSEIKKTILLLEKRELYWIRGTIKHKGDAVSPRIKDCIFNVVKATNRNTNMNFTDFNIINNKEIKLKAQYLNLTGESVLQKNISEGLWVNVEKNQYSMEVDEINNNLVITFENETNGIHRIISSLKEFYQIIGSGNGLPNQNFHLDFENVITDELMLQVGFYDRKIKQYLYRDFLKVDDFVSTQSGDYSFQCDFEESVIRFGNDEKGNVPMLGSDNIRFISYQLSNFDEGNVHIGEIDKTDIQSDIIVMNDYPAIGGQKRISFDDEKELVQKSMKTIKRAVSLDDYELLTRNIPGIRLRKVKAISNHLSKNQISVIVVPYTTDDELNIDDRFLKAVRTELDKYRLLGTRLDVIGPQIIDVEFDIGIVLSSDSLFEKNIFEEKLIEKYSIDSEDNKIGVSLKKNDVFHFISQFSGIHKVDYLWIDSSGRNVIKDKTGNVIIPPNGIIKISKCNITISK